MKHVNSVAVCFIAFCIAYTLFGLMQCGNTALAEEGPRLSVLEAIQHVQPRIEPDRAEFLKDIIEGAAEEYDLPPRLIVSIIFHESSFSPRVESRDILGSRGEIGLMQLMPNGPWRAHLPEGCTEALETAECQIQTGAAWLAESRRRCPGSPYRWVAAYGRGGCISERQAGSEYWVRSRIRLFVNLGGSW